ncbi:hypothetical protein GJAV_G00083720 [Gymnothorax javanicus]|nr:hypothetical protein GJAV_G00083720 [Gymnothorax javanicus]
MAVLPVFLQAKRKDAQEQSEGTGTSPGEEEAFSWPGPKTLCLRRTSQGFGFTLRHFIVYPPESAVHSSIKDEDGGNRGRPRTRLEPMDTIFVKQVKEGGPAHGAGLCTGDRIVKVNGESIIGKTYSQVIALIQNSDRTLELCVMPKDEDILQLAYSQDAYLKGNEAYTGNARHIPEPPPVCYPRIDPKPTAMSQSPDPPPSAAGQGGRGAWLGSPPGGAADTGYRVEIPVPPSPPPQVPKTQTVVCVCNESVRTAVMPPEVRLSRSGQGYRTEENQYAAGANLHLVRSRPSGGSLQYPAGRSADAPMYPQGGRTANYPACPDVHSPSVRSSLAVPGDYPDPSYPSPTATSPAAHQNIDWRNYTTYKEYIDAKRLHMYGCRTIQERLDCLRAASQATGEYKQPLPRGLAGAGPSPLRRRSTSHDRGYARPVPLPVPPRSVSQERLDPAEMAAAALRKDWPRSASQDALISTPAGAHKPRARSCDYLVRHDVPPPDRQGYGRAETEALLYREAARTGRVSVLPLRASHQSLRNSIAYAGGGTSGPRGAQSTPQFPRGTEPLLTSRADALTHSAPSQGNRSMRLPVKTAGDSAATSPSTTDPPKDQRASNRLPHAAHHPRPRAESAQERSKEAGLSIRSASCSAPCKAPMPGVSPTSNGAVTLRAKPPSRPSGREAVAGDGAGPDVVILREKSGPNPIRHHSYILAVNDTEAEPGTNSTCWLPNDTRREVNIRRLDEQRKASCSSNLDDSLDSIPFIDEPSSPSFDHDGAHIPASAVISVTPVITTIPPSPTSPSPLIRRQLSHDQDSLRLSILGSESGTKTERSKSYDEGLDNYREEGRGRASVKNLPGLKGLRKAVDRSSEDSGSRRDSSSDVFSDSTKEGVLHFRQLNTDKSKRVGGGMRQWKQMYAVLRGHSLYLYKDRKEGQAAAASRSEDQQQPISIKACLIDISYSDTKRKNVLRLTTSDCEYLFQAEDREDMLSWIRVIQENSNLDEEDAGITSRDLISRKIKEYSTLMSPPSGKTEPSPKSSRQSLSIRHTLLGGKGESKTLLSPHSPRQDSDRKALHKDDCSPPKDKGTWRKGIPGLMRKPFEKKCPPGVTFGVRLDDCPPAQTNRFVPLIVEICCKLVEERGLEYTGIYRVPGNNAAISSMQEELNRGMSDIDIHEDKWRDLNVISSLLKSFFRKLPEPLFTNEKYADFIEANRTEDAVERLKVLKRLLRELPDHHYETLKFLSAHLKTVADNSEKNKMEPRNLAIVFGPTLVRTSEDNMTHMVTHMPDQYKIVETLIQHYGWFFTEDGGEEPMTGGQQENAVESQPVPNIDHLLTNIGRTGTSPGDVSDSATSDSTKSKQGSWGSGKDQYSRDLLVSSIFAAASRKRKKPKEKPLPSSSDDDLDGVFSRKEPPSQNRSWAQDGSVDLGQADEANERKGRAMESEGSGLENERSEDELRDLLVAKERTASVPPSPSPYHMKTAAKTSLSDPPSHLEEAASDLGTMSSHASAPKGPNRRWVGPEPGGAAAGAEVSSITSDYSTTSSMTFLTGAESSALSPEVQSVTESRGDEADDERSELVSEGRPAETDSESEFSVFAAAPSSASLGLSSEQTPLARERTPPGSETAGTDGSTTPKLDGRRLFPSHKLIECDTLSRRRSLRQKTDSESSTEGGRSDREPNRLSRVLEVMKKGRSTGSLLSVPSRSDVDRPEPAWRLKITERLKFRLKTSADDMFGVGTQKARPAEGRKKKNIRRRHTMGGQQDFAELAVTGDWAGEGADLSAVDRLRPKCSSQDFSIRDWIARERCRAGGQEPSPDAPAATAEAELELEFGREGARPSPSPSPGPQSAEQVNGGSVPGKNKSPSRLAGDAHPHKLSGAQVVRSRFHQYL